jgi:hypothetical protein
MGKRMYRDSRTGATFKTIKGRVVKIHSGKDQYNHVIAHDMEPRLKKSDGRHDYDIVRFYKNPNQNSRFVRYGLTEREAVKHTNDPSTSTEKYFDGMQRRY